MKITKLLLTRTKLIDSETSFQIDSNWFKLQCAPNVLRQPRRMCKCKCMCKTFNSFRIKTINHGLRLVNLQCYMVSRGRRRTQTHALIAKSRARRSWCCGLALFHGLVLYIGWPHYTFPPRTEFPKKSSYAHVMYVCLNAWACQEKRVNASKKPYSWGISIPLKLFLTHFGFRNPRRIYSKTCINRTPY